MALHVWHDFDLSPVVDPLDVPVMINAPTFPGCVLEARPSGIFYLRDRGKADDNMLAVLHYDPFFADIKDDAELPAHFPKELTRFFSAYKDLEAVPTEALGGEGPEVAKERVKYAIDIGICGQDG